MAPKTMSSPPSDRSINLLRRQKRRDTSWFCHDISDGRAALALAVRFEHGTLTSMPRTPPGAEDLAALKVAIDDFVERVYADNMIGFFFARFDKQTLKDREFEFAARALGADIAYAGRPIAKAHSQHRIMGGQFNRRLTLLREALTDHGLSPDIISDLLLHTEKLRSAVTTQPADTCLHQGAAGPLLSSWTPGTRAATGEANTAAKRS